MDASATAKASARNTDSLYFAVIVVGALIVRLTFVLNVPAVPVSDFGWYYHRAIEIANGLGYIVQGYPTAYWPAGWPYFLSVVIRIFGPSVLAAQIVQALLNALTAGFAFLIGRVLFGRGSGLAAGTAYALLPSAVEWSATLASEPLYTLLWTISTYIWISRNPQRVGWFAFAGALLGAAALVRPSALLFWVVLLAYVLAERRERARLPQWIPAIAVTALCTLVVVTPLIVRNYRVFGTLVVVSNNGGVSLYQGNNAESGGGYTELNNAQIQKLISDPRTEVAGDRLASRLAMQYILSHPAHEFVLAIRKIKALYQGDDSVIRYTVRSRHFRVLQWPPGSDPLASALVLTNTIGYYGLMLFALLGLIVCFRKRRDETSSSRWMLVLFLVLYNTAIFALILGVDRYRYPVMPYFAVFAGFGFTVSRSYILKRLREYFAASQRRKVLIAHSRTFTKN